MKKFLCMVLAVLMLVMSVAAVAEAPKFDKSKLTGSPLYKYDKFSKEWRIYGSYVKEYRDSTIEVSFLLFDVYVDRGDGPELRIEYFNKETNQYDQVTAFRAIVGDKMFCFEKLSEGNNCGFAFGGSVMEEFSKALIAGGEVAFQIDHIDAYGNGWTTTIDPVNREELTDLVTMARLLRDSHAWDIDPDKEGSDARYGATME